MANWFDKLMGLSNPWEGITPVVPDPDAPDRQVREAAFLRSVRDGEGISPSMFNVGYETHNHKSDGTDIDKILPNPRRVKNLMRSWDSMPTAGAAVIRDPQRMNANQAANAIELGGEAANDISTVSSVKTNKQQWEDAQEQYKKDPRYALLERVWNISRAGKF